MEAETKVNLASCPAEILALDANAETLWRVLLRKVGVTIAKGEHIEDKRAWILRAARLEIARLKQEKEAGHTNDCEQCNLPLPDGHKSKYCDRACRQAAYRLRVAAHSEVVDLHDVAKMQDAA